MDIDSLTRTINTLFQIREDTGLLSVKKHRKKVVIVA